MLTIVPYHCSTVVLAMSFQLFCSIFKHHKAASWLGNSELTVEYEEHRILEHGVGW